MEPKMLYERIIGQGTINEPDGKTEPAVRTSLNGQLDAGFEPAGEQSMH